MIEEESQSQGQGYSHQMFVQYCDEGDMNLEEDQVSEKYRKHRELPHI